MTTTSAAMGGDETPEQKEARIKANRAAGAEKARAARQAQAELRHSQATALKEGALPTFTRPTLTPEEEIWRAAFFIAMRNFDVRSEKDLPRCTAVADAALEEIRKQGKL